jgi:hypothetical protein
MSMSLMSGLVLAVNTPSCFCRWALRIYIPFAGALIESPALNWDQLAMRR